MGTINGILMEVYAVVPPPPPPAFETKIGSKARRAEIGQITERIHSEE